MEASSRSLRGNKTKKFLRSSPSPDPRGSVGGVIRWFEHRQVYAPRRELEGHASDLQRPFEEILFATADGLKLHGWFFPAAADAPRSRQVLLLCHGNAGNISHRLHFVKAWLELGLNVFVFDYRGYGRSEGRVDEPGTYLDAQAAWQWLRQRGFAAQDIIVLGKSLGGGIASDLALREKPGALILQSTFTSIPDLGCELFPWLPVRKLHRIRYDTINRLPQLRAPILVAHSRKDNLIGFHHAERNFDAAQAPKALLEIAGNHVSVIEDGRSDYLAGLERFLAEHLHR